MIRLFLMNLLLSFIWVALTGSMYYTNFMFGFLLGFGILWVMNRNDSDQRYFFRVPKVLGFVFYFFVQMVKANLQVAYDVMTPRYFMKPGIVRYPMNARTELEINLLATMISLTPGTLIMDVSEDKRNLYIHVMYLNDPEVFIKDMKTGLERKLLEILR
ncbi:MAG TPA: Na+/H+ antiporter subunit E [Sphingobacterium sp.]|nr:Na+/H+ antiporter subunit E [Sphingobacterium sp.]